MLIDGEIEQKYDLIRITKELKNKYKDGEIENILTMITVGKKIYREKLRKKYELIRITRAASRANPVLSPNGED